MAVSARVSFAVRSAEWVVLAGLLLAAPGCVDIIGTVDTARYVERDEKQPQCPRRLRPHRAMAAAPFHYRDLCDSFARG